MLEDYRKRFGGDGEVKIYRAPGRVNLIGEHTDYNLGFVLPIALDLETRIASGPSSDGRLHVYSENVKGGRDWGAGEIPNLTPAGDWTDYVIGVAQKLAQAGYEVRPRNFLIRSTVPDGSGLSSSASLEVSSALAVLDGREIDPLEMAKLCQRAEIDFVGVPCGIMDQYVSIFGKTDSAVKIDCRSLEHEFVELPPVVILAVNSMVKHDLAVSAYRERTEQCAMAVDAIRRSDPKVESLRDATLKHVEEVAMPAVVARRARHVVTENARVNLFVSAAKRGDLDRMGELFNESHLSMQHDYEITCEEIDFLVDAAVGIEGVYGSRMTGGGFGGCTVNLVRADAVAQFSDQISRRYQERFGITPPVFRCIPSQGAGPVRD